MKGLDFILTFIKNNALMDDLVLNTQRADTLGSDTPPDKRPLLNKAFNALGVETGDQMPASAKTFEMQSVLKSYEDFVALSDTPGGAFKVSVTHENPARAADLANQFVLQLKGDLERERGRATPLFDLCVRAAGRCDFGRQQGRKGRA